LNATPATDLKLKNALGAQPQVNTKGLCEEEKPLERRQAKQRRTQRN